MGRKRLGPEPSPEQERLLDQLGGNAEVARLVSCHFNFKEPLTRQAVYYWRQRGIPWCYRACLAITARELGVSVPANFLNENPATVRTGAQLPPAPSADEVPWL